MIEEGVARRCCMCGDPVDEAFGYTVYYHSHAPHEPLYLDTLGCMMAWHVQGAYESMKAINEINAGTVGDEGSEDVIG